MADTLRSHTATITVSGGTGTIDSSDFTSPKVIIDAGGYIEQVLISAPDSASQFDFRIETPNSNVAYREKNKTGELIDNTHTPIRGTYDFIISNAEDGIYTIEIIVLERW